jgi:hypothetical protein
VGTGRWGPVYITLVSGPMMLLRMRLVWRLAAMPTKRQASTEMEMYYGRFTVVSLVPGSSLSRVASSPYWPRCGRRLLES